MRRLRRSGREQPRHHLAPAGDLAPRPGGRGRDRPGPVPVECWRHGGRPVRLIVRRRVDDGVRVGVTTLDDGPDR
jgi:hypothetical protein